MKEPIEINGKLFVPVRHAAERSNYSPDHITRLAKTNKITATQLGRFWFVHERSLKNYIADQQTEVAARQQLLSKQRQVELAVRSALANAETNQLKRSNKSGPIAVVFTCLLLLGVAITSQVVSSVPGSVASVISSSPSTVGPAVATTPKAIQPVFSDGSRVVVTDAGRVVDKPAVTPQWVQITP